MDVDYSWNNGLATILDNSYSKINLNEIELYINGTYSQVSINH